MNCPKCGTENPNNAQSCWFCSLALISTPATSPQQAQGVKTSGLAIASLVLGILSPFTCFVTAIPAIIFGIVALVKIGKSTGQLKGNGLAIAGICVPAVALPLMALLMAIMMPALARTRTIAQRMVCATNLSGLGKAMLIYANDYNDIFPTTSKWCDLLVEYQNVSKQTFACPAALTKYRSVRFIDQCNYAMNKNVEKLGENAPPDMVLLFESQPGWNQSGGPEILTTDNHYEGCNIAFVDGHVEFAKTKDLKNLRWTTRENEIAPPEPVPIP
jgi:prepilin-type processing-associated H-X9-DG protein